MVCRHAGSETQMHIGDFSVFVRVPSSLELGELSLQRVACRRNSDTSIGGHLLRSPRFTTHVLPGIEAADVCCPPVVCNTRSESDAGYNMQDEGATLVELRQARTVAQAPSLIVVRPPSNERDGVCCGSVPTPTSTMCVKLLRHKCASQKRSAIQSMATDLGFTTPRGEPLLIPM